MCSLNICKRSGQAWNAVFVWFRSHKAELVKHSMLKDVRISAGLGTPLERFTTNAGESLNSLIKSGVHFQKSQLPDFVDKLHAMIEEQECEIERAIIEVQAEFTVSTSRCTCGTVRAEENISSKTGFVNATVKQCS